MIQKTLSALLLGALFLGNVSSQDTGGDEEAIKQTLIRIWAAIEANDMDEYAKYLHPDFSAFGETDTYLAEGKELELRSVESYLSRARNVHTEMHQPKVTIRGEVAWITYYWTDEGISQSTRLTSRGKSTRIFVRENGRWLCIHGHYTLVE